MSATKSAVKGGTLTRYRNAADVRERATDPYEPRPDTNELLDLIAALASSILELERRLDDREGK